MWKRKRQESDLETRLEEAYVEALDTLTVAEGHLIDVRRQLAEGALHDMPQEARARLDSALPLFVATERTARDALDRIEEQQRALRESKNIRILAASVRVTLLAAFASLLAALPQLVDGVVKLVLWARCLRSVWV